MNNLKIAGVAAALLLGAGEAAARSPVRDGPSAGRGAHSSVTECSRYGNGCYTAPVRHGRFGLEMRLKGGTWIDCRGSCRDTLREETVDFWDTLRERSRD
ncbi:MAG: hypothetical protein ABL901_00395 [Hyphomicrobiaceae bacterium]